MKRMLIFGAGFAAGYVLGAKAGRDRYDQIVHLASDAPRHLPGSVSELTGVMSDRAADVTEAARAKAHEKAHDAVDRADRAIDDAADQAQELRQRSERRLTG